LGNRQSSLDVALIAQLNDWYACKNVFVTGHTGFKGAWLAKWLQLSGAHVTGYALPPETGRPNLFELAGIGSSVSSTMGDICDGPSLENALLDSRPEVVFHLAAQSLVRRSYSNPIETYRTNVLGTAQILDTVRGCDSVRSVVVVTSDKCYENTGSDHLYGETAPMGGHDPYSSSKGCAELVTSAYRRSYFSNGNVAIASARAGNVIGPGDWAEDRLVPDLITAAASGKEAIVRNPSAIRPWQFVLDPLRGYLMLGRALADNGQQFASGWNFGPSEKGISVADLANTVRNFWPTLVVKNESDTNAPHEAAVLGLDSAKANALLGWMPAVSLSRAIEMTVDGYQRLLDADKNASITMKEILESYWNEVAPGAAS
jgi:CDP-glucose 4,6-dehydratase